MRTSSEIKSIYEQIERRKKKNIYEMFCDFSFNLLRLKFDENVLKNEENVIKFSGLKIFPTSNISAAAIFFMSSLFAIILFSIFFGLSPFFFLLLMSFFFTFLIYYYPYLLMKIMRAQASSEMVLCITYMVISLSQVPNLENAIVFAYKNLKGPVKKDLGDILADFINNKIHNFEEGLEKIVDKWYVEAKEFSEALKLLIAYSRNPYKGKKLLDEAVNLAVDNSYQRMERYARNLKLPTTAILVLGLILPIIGLTLIPMITIFLPELLNITGVFFIYNLFLPTILFILVTLVIEGRPLTTSLIKLEGGDTFAFKLFGRSIDGFLLLTMIAVSIAVIFGTMIYLDTRNYQMCTSWMNDTFAFDKKPSALNLDINECKELLTDLVSSILKPSLFLLVIVCIFSIPLFLHTNRIIEKMEKIRKIESELGTSLLQIAHNVKIGTPFEASILTMSIKSQNFEIEELFKNLKENLILGKSLKNAFFEEKIGVAHKYNSSLLTSVFDIILDVSSKGSYYLSEALETVSRYLQTLSNLQNKIEDLISDNVSTINFMSFFLNPVVAGVSVALGMIIMAILTALSMNLPNIMPQDVSGIPTMGLPFLDTWKLSTIPPMLFQLVIGIYLIELSIISGYLVTGLEKGFDYTVVINYISKILLVSTFLFLVISIVIYLSLSGLALSIFEIGV